MLEVRAFEPEFIKRLDRLVIASRQARAVRSGRRMLGRAHGTGIEVENFRPYSEGEDLRFLDWNAFARLDDLTIRTYRPERQVELTVLVDTSASMALPAADDKFGLARALAAALAYVGMSDNDAVRIATFGMRRDSIVMEATSFRRRRELYHEFLPFLSGLRCAGETRLRAAVGRLLLDRRPPGIVILVSDFLVPADDYEAALKELLAAHHEIKVVHVMGEQESTGAYLPGYYRIRDSETGELREVVLSPQSAAAFKRKAEQIAERLRNFCHAHAIAYVKAFGARNLDNIVAREIPVLGLVT